MNITKQQFLAYETVRLSGVTNMFDTRVVTKLSELSEAQVLTIMKNYTALKNKYMKEGEHMNITIKKDISLERISDLLTSAFEGGSNYWYMIEKKTSPTTWEIDSCESEGKHYLCDYPLNPGGALLISDLEESEGTHRLDLKSIKKGLEIMADKYPKHYSDFISEDDDADTGDVFLQCCLFGKLIFG